MNSDTSLIPTPELKLEIVKEAPDFETVFLERKKLLEKVEKFDPVESVEDTPRMNEAKRLRLDLVKKRTFLDGLRKNMGESARKRVNTINEMFRSWIDENESAERYLKEQEDFAINFEASRKAELRQERLAAWKAEQLPEDFLIGFDPGELVVAVWEGQMESGRRAKRERAEAAEAERHKAEADRKERERLQRENLKLQQERDALAKQQQETDDAKRRAEEEKKKADAKAKRAPDKQKLLAYIQEIHLAAEKYPPVKDEASLILDTFKLKMKKLLEEVTVATGKL